MPDFSSSSADSPRLSSGEAAAQESGIPFFRRLYVRIAAGLIAFFVLAVTATIEAVRHGGRDQLEAQALKLNAETGSKIVLKLNERLGTARALAQSVAQSARSLPGEVDLVKRVLPEILNAPGMQSLVAGGGYWPEPGRFTPGVERRSFFWGRGPTGLLQYYDDYNEPRGRGYHQEEWYVPARFVPAGKVYWSSTYVDAYSLEPMVTCVSPMWSGGEFVGASTIDLKLTGLGEFLEEAATSLGGYAFALDHNNRIIAAPPGLGRRVLEDSKGLHIEELLTMAELARLHDGFQSIFREVDALDAAQVKLVRVQRDRGLVALAGDLEANSYQISATEAVRISANLLAGDQADGGAVQFRLPDDFVLHEPVIVSLFTVPGAHWKIIVVTPASLATSAASAIARQITWWMVVLVFAVCAAGAAVSYRHIIRPLSTLMSEVKRLETSDDETARIRLSGRDELARIAYWFNARTTRLAHALNHLRRKNQALEHATHAAEEANRSKNVFLASMSHEIRTPMHAIIGMAGILKETHLTAEQADFTSTIQTSADSLLSLINDIMDFSKIEAGKLDMESIDFDARVILEGVCELIAFQAVEKGLELVCHFNPRAPALVRGDPGRLRQILLNLAGNAVKFTTSGTVAIHGDCAVQPDGRPRLRIEVRDSGIGIPREAIGRLFKPFSQVDDSTTRRFGGTGLGLAVCKRLCELMDGSIEVESAPGSGSTFRIDLLLHPASEVPSFPTLPPARHALIIDPSAAHRRVLRDVLESWSFVVADCRTVDEVAALITLRPAIDLVFSGVSAEAHNAVTTALHHAAPHRVFDVVVHACQHRASNYAVSAELLLTKPLKYSQLVDMLVRLSRSRRAPAHDRVHSAAPEGHERLPAGQVSGETDRVRVLIVEDNAVNQKVAQRLLAKMGITAAAVADGLQGLDAVKAHSFELVLMDWQMPVMDGLEATRAIRALGGRFVDLPIIAVTANAMQGDRERCLDAGMNDYLSKPIAPDKLRAIVEQWMNSPQR